MKKLVDIKQVSEATGIAVKTLYDWVSKNKIPHYRIHGMLRFDPEKVSYWLSRKEVKIQS